MKIARMIPKGAHAAVPVAAFLVGNEEDSGIKARVRRLLEIASAEGEGKTRKRRLPGLFPCVSAGLTLIALFVHHAVPDVLASVHVMIEHTVQLLS